MEPLLRNIIEYGMDPCVLKLVCKQWRYFISLNDKHITESMQWKTPDASLPMIVMIIIDTGEKNILYKLLNHMSIPIINWNLISYLVNDKHCAELIYGRIHNSHTREMIRRLSIPVPIPPSETFKIKVILKNDHSYACIKQMESIISSGYVDAVEYIYDNMEDKDALDMIIENSILLLSQGIIPINVAVLNWMLKNHYYVSTIKSILGPTVTPENIPFRISCDIDHPKINAVPLSMFHQCGSNILRRMIKSIDMCKRYLDSNHINIRVIDAILRYSGSIPMKKKASDIAIKYGWEQYVPILQ